MAKFEDKIEKLIEKSKSSQKNKHGEHATKQYIIMPFIRALGYNDEDDKEVVPEFIADANGVKEGDKVDYAIKINGEPIIFIEAKSTKEPLIKHTSQLSRYFNAFPDVKAAILINGIEAWFYTDLDRVHLMDHEPFFKFNFQNHTDEEVGRLSFFCKERFSNKEIETQAQNWKREKQIQAEIKEDTNKIKNYIKENIINSSDLFTEFVVRYSIGGRFHRKYIKKYQPIVQSIFDELLHGDKQKIASPDNNAKPAPTPSKDSKSNEKEKSKGIHSSRVESFRHNEPTKTLLRIYKQAILGLGDDITMIEQELSDPYSKNGKAFASIRPKGNSIQINLVLPELEELTERQKEKMQGFNPRQQKTPTGVGNYERLEITATEGEEFDQIIEQVKYAYDIA